MFAFNRYIQEEEDRDPEVIEYRNQLLTLSLFTPEDGEESTSNSDNKADKQSPKTANSISEHRMGDICNIPEDIKKDTTSAYFHLKRFTDSVRSEQGKASSAATPNSLVYG